MESAVDSLNRHADSWAARCFQVSFKQYFEVEQALCYLEREDFLEFVLRKLAFCCFPFFGGGGAAEPAGGAELAAGGAETAGTRRSVLDCELYVPTMAFISYTLLSCLSLGLNAQ